MFNVYSGLIKMMDSFRDDGNDIKIKYLLDANYEELIETYKLKEIADDKNDFTKVLNLLEWISTNIFHYGNYDNHVTNTAKELFEYSFGKGKENGINCRSLSLALTECLLAVGIKARTVYIMPFSPYDFDNHVVCEAWINELNKWIMIDPTYNLYAVYKNNPLNIFELRNLLANQEKVLFNNNAHYNNSAIDVNEIMTYYVKDLFRFMLSDIQGSNSEKIDGRILINVAPFGYDVKQYTLTNIDFRIKQNGENENMKIWRKNVEDDIIIYKGLVQYCLIIA